MMGVHQSRKKILRISRGWKSQVYHVVKLQGCNLICESFGGWKKNTPQKFNIAPEKWWLEDEFPFGIAYF